MGNTLFRCTIGYLSNIINQPLVLPRTASLNITSKCNSKCGYCDIWKHNQAQAGDEPTLTELTKLSSSLKKLGVKEITLSGGEPLLRHDLEEILAVFTQQKMRVRLITNGILLSKDRMERLIKAGLQYIGLSLDTFNSEIYQKLRGVKFELAEQALDSINYGIYLNPQLNVGVNCVITRYNIGELADFIFKILGRIRGKVVIIFQGYMKVPGRKEDDMLPGEDMYPVLMNEIKQLIKMKNHGIPILNSSQYLRKIPDYLIHNQLNGDFSCQAGYKTVTINEKLQLYPCHYLPMIGDLREQSLEEIWFSRKMQTERYKMLKGRCQGCLCISYRDKLLSPYHKIILMLNGIRLQKAMMKNKAEYK